MKKSIGSLVAAVLTVTLILTGCGGGDKSSSSSASSDDTSNTLRLATNEEIQTADVQKTTEDYTIPMNIFDRLVEVKLDENGETKIVPSLAESWDISEDGLTYTFHLRKGVKFHNGEEFKADDAKYTFERMLKPETEALNQDFIDAISGAQDMMDGKADSLKGLEVVDDYTVKMTLDEPFAPFLANLSTPGVSIYNRKATEEAGADFGIKPELTVGTGPFKFDSWVLNSEEQLVAFDDYWNERPKLDRISFKVVKDPETLRMMFESGELDELDLDTAPQQIKYFLDSDKYKNWIVSRDKVGIYYMSLNENIEPLNDVRVRKAIQMGIDRQAILDTVYSGKGTVQSGIFPPGLIGYNKNLPVIEYNPEKAKELLKEAGYPNGFEMEISQDSESVDSTVQTYELIQSMLAQIGIKVNINVVDEATWFSTRAEGKLGSYVTNWSADFNDPDNFIYTFFAPTNTVKRSFNYNNGEASNEVVKARTIVNEDERIKLYQDLEKKIIQEDAAWVPLYSKQHLFVVNPRVKNYKILWNGWSGNMYHDMYIEE